MNDRLETRLEALLYGAALLLGAAILGWLLLSARHGFDFTDEGYYLNFIAHPDRYTASLSQFGFIYHPLYKVLGGDVALLRQANILLTLALGTWLSNLVLLRVTTLHDEHRRGIAFILGISSLSLLALWLPTPSYNSLTLQAILLTLIGLLQLDMHKHGWVLLALGGWLCLLAKPTTAVAFALLIGIYLVLTQQWRRQEIRYAIFTVFGLVLLTSLLIDGSPIAFCERLAASYREGLALYAGNLPHLFRWDDSLISAQGRLLVTLSVLAILAIAFTPMRTVAYSLYSMVVALGFWIVGTHGLRIEPNSQIGLMLGAPLLAAIALRIGERRRGVPMHLYFAGLLALLPYGYAFGSSNNYWAMAVHAGICWVLAAIMLQPRLALPIAVTAQFATLIILTLATEHPYRQAHPLHEQRTVATLANGSQLQVSAPVAEYMAALSSPVPSDTSIIDLTGQSPGAIYVVGGNAIVSPWVLGGYAGSEELLRTKLAVMPCQILAESWVLTEPNGTRSMPTSLLAERGISLGAPVIRTTAPANGELPDRRQILYKPRNSEASYVRCEASNR